MKIKRVSIVIAAVFICAFMMQITAFAADNFSSGGTVTPEKDVYYVGDTVDISDLFKNKSGSTAFNVSVEYYYRLNGANSVYSGSPIAYGNIPAAKSESHSFSYTFKESDIGDYRIGAKITYTMGGVTYDEYSSGHDFAVEAAPTPTPEPSFTPTPVPTNSPTPTPEPTIAPEQTEEPEATMELIATFTPQPENEGDESIEESSGLSALLQDRGVIMMLIIVAGVILILLIILLIVAVTKKR